MDRKREQSLINYNILMNRLVLIDGNAILHRAYHALPPLTAPDGSVVNAVYGFVSILIKIFNDLKPTYMAVAFDRPEPTFRKSLYKDYQGKRPEMEDALVTQIPKVQDVVRAFGIPIYDKAGFEADDVIGTVCQLATRDKRQETRKIDEVIIVTGDKDILQLVDDKKGVKVFMPTKGLSEGKLYGEAEVVEKMGVTPRQIPELKALMGDQSDNYPGVAGIGPKIAADLVTGYGSVEELYKKVKGKRPPAGRAGKTEKGEVGLSDALLEKLQQGEESARMSKDLATIRTDIAVAMGELSTITTLDTPEVRSKLQEFNFPSLIKRLGEREKEEKGDKKGQKKNKNEKKAEQQELF